jgi:hypothetical protein
MTDTMTDALRKCRDKFAEYAELHRAKIGTKDAHTPAKMDAVLNKVERNREMVALCDAALASTPTVADDGKLVERLRWYAENWPEKTLLAETCLEAATRLEQPSGMREALQECADAIHDGRYSRLLKAEEKARAALSHQHKGDDNA